MEAIRKKLSCEILVDLDSAGPGPLHERLTRTLRSAIREGVLGADGILPPSRVLAGDLGCSRWVVTQAYEQLVAEGYLTSRPGSATRVRRVEGSRPGPRICRDPDQPPLRYDLSPGLPDLREFPRKRWSDAARSQLSTLSFTELGFPHPRGIPHLRKAIASYLRRVRGADGSADDVTIGSSATQGIRRVCVLLREEGIRRIAVEDPGWTRLRQAVSATGLEVVGVPVDEQGIQVEELERHEDIRAVIVTPAHQFPNGIVLAPDRRAALLDWAARVDGLVLEDDYDAEFRYDRRPVGTLQGTEPSRVALFGSLSKTLSPSVGLGWTVTPRRWTEKLDAHTGLVPPSGLEQYAFTAFLGTGEYDRHIRAARHRYRHRRDRLLEALRSCLPDCEVSGIAAGLHLVLHLPTGVDPSHAVNAAAELDVEVMDMDAYRVRPDPARPALVLGYGNIPDNSVEPAVELLTKAIRA